MGIYLHLLTNHNFADAHVRSTMIDGLQKFEARVYKFCTIDNGKYRAFNRSILADYYWLTRQLHIFLKIFNKRVIFSFSILNVALIIRK